ncbi:hypothetical protein PV11_03547 [Exophiala sideris]|uniref:Uncharacterized protein n=1 Tax=Exophiala sideris TaxID=1016849 RepID=A0A0D1X1J1_9EURO|nr:hypothetical protein PV11_03547 [Exophiala sideris]
MAKHQTVRYPCPLANQENCDKTFTAIASMALDCERVTKDKIKNGTIRVEQQKMTEEMQEFNGAWVDKLPDVQL